MSQATKAGGPTTAGEEAKAKGPATAGDQAIAAYLEADPEFFLRHPDLTARLRLPHGPAGTLSLVEHQLSLLRHQIESDRQLLTQLIARVRDNEALAARFHSLMVQLIAAPDRPALEARLHESLRREFQTEAVALFFDDQPPPPADNPEPSGGNAVRCGPLDAGRARWLFAAAADGIRSAALIPLHGPHQSGLLAIGSRDPEHFRADMGTDHLNRLGELVSACLGALERSHG